MRILHLGVYDRNIGDSIALVNARRSWNEIVPNIEWSQKNIESFWARKNDVAYCKKFFSSLSGKVDAVLVGGGGLIEDYHGQGTNYKLPFNREILEACPVPVFFHGVGLNVFRGNTGYGEEAVKAIQETIDYSSGFSVRNDGSYEKMRDWVGLDVSKVPIIPDPGLLFLDRFNIPEKEELITGGFQPAINVGKYINDNRFLNDNNLETVKNLSIGRLTFPHTIRDAQSFKLNSICSPQEFDIYKKTDNLDRFIENYKKIDYIVAMRGHGQLMSIGLNIPGIYLSTQDKVLDFSILNGYEEYNIDIREENWREELDRKIYLLTEKNSELARKWYNLRETNLPSWYQQSNKFIKECLKKTV
jgi:polysaccharide pyruvyl transferase WcaK-like protein